MKNFEVSINKETSDEEAEQIILNLKVGQFVVLRTGYLMITRVPGGWILSVYEMKNIFINKEKIKEIFMNKKEISKFCETCEKWQIEEVLFMTNLNRISPDGRKMEKLKENDIDYAPCDYCKKELKVVYTHRGRFQSHRKFGCIYHEEKKNEIS